MTELAQVIASAFMFVLGFAFIGLGLSLPIYYMQYQILVFVGSVILMIVGLWLLMQR
jgi:membrane protein implicated in regulation of membrane protease activity